MVAERPNVESSLWPVLQSLGFQLQLTC